MSLRDKIIDYYVILLELGWLAMDESGEVCLVIGDERMPATIDGKRLIVPTIEQMKNYNWDDRIGFHPLRESYNLGISDVLANLRDQYVMRLNVTIAYLMKELIDIGFNVAGQKELTTDQGQVLNALPHCNKNTVACFESLQKKTRAQNNADQFINIFIRKGGMVEGKTFGRAGIVTFPIYQKLVEGEEKINGVKISNKDREMFISLFRFIFPTIDNVDAYNVGVNTRTAPFLEALIRATFNVVDDLVEASAPYLPIVAMPTILTFPKELGIWKEIFEDRDLFERLAATIPNLSRGEEAVVEEKPTRSTSSSSSSSRSEPERTRDREPEAAAPKPRGRMILGDAAPAVGTFVGKSSAGRETSNSSNDRQVVPVATGRAASRDIELDREAERRRREEEDRERRQREKEEEEDRRRRELRRKEDDEVERKRRQLRDELDRLEGRGGRDRDDRDYDDRDRGRSTRDRDDRGTRGRTGDPFDDNPALRANLRDEEDRGRGRSSRDRDYDDRDGRRRGIRDIRDGGRDDRTRGRGRGRDYYDDDRDRDYDPRDVRYRGRR